MVISIHSDSRSSDINSVATDTLKDFSRRDFYVDAYLTGQIVRLTENNNLLTDAHKEKKAESVLGPKDEIRDEALRVIFYEVEAKKRWRDAQIKEAAKVIDKELDKYGFETINLAFSTESTNINALLKDLNKPKVVEAISMLPGLNVLISHLKEAQDDFHEAWIEFVDLQLANEKTLSATKLGKLVRNQINRELVIYLQGAANAKPEVYKECFDVITEIIEINNNKVRNRKGKSDDKSSEELQATVS